MSDSQPDLQQSPYDLLGGEKAVRELVDRFYDYMDELPQANLIRSLHAKSLKSSREKLFLFLSGWLGGPNLYIEKYGHPMLRKRHFPFAIGEQEANEWLMCMSKAMDDMSINDQLRAFLDKSFHQTAHHMKNKL